MIAAREEILPALRAKLGNTIQEVFEKSPKRIYLQVKAEHIPQTSRILFKELEARFQIATGIDTPGAFEILYHWAFDLCNCVVTIKTKLDREKPEIESIATFCPAAEWIEREMWELLGITFKNHPDMRHLLLKDDWPEGRYPLRRDYNKDMT
ncbi:MAG: NADH-quinone oxidoreductase subunit C [Chitinispirillaceae bacterium]|nr:NADH-quinone oxidoreductase subunit C [Chitinispirillaceae bacterium]